MHIFLTRLFHFLFARKTCFSEILSTLLSFKCIMHFREGDLFGRYLYEFFHVSLTNYKIIFNDDPSKPNQSFLKNLTMQKCISNNLSPWAVIYKNYFLNSCKKMKKTLTKMHTLFKTSKTYNMTTKFQFNKIQPLDDWAL